MFLASEKFPGGRGCLFVSLRRCCQNPASRHSDLGPSCTQIDHLFRIPSIMEDQKPSTADILAKIRAQKAAAAAASGEAPAVAPEIVTPEATTPVVVPGKSATPVPVVSPLGGAADTNYRLHLRGRNRRPTKDIMAAIRGGGAKAGAATHCRPVAGCGSSIGPCRFGYRLQKPGQLPSAGPRPSVQDMLKAVREGQGWVMSLHLAQPVAAKSQALLGWSRQCRPSQWWGGEVGQAGHLFGEGSPVSRRWLALVRPVSCSGLSPEATF